MQKQKLSPINLDKNITYKDYSILKNFITDQGKILPRRDTNVSIKQQRALTKAIKQGRILKFF